MNVGLLLCRMMCQPGRPDQSKRRIACIGDSITFGAGVMQKRKTEAWPALWQKSLGSGWQVLNYGVSGATLQREGDFPYCRLGFLRSLDRAEPETIVLMLGTNDSKPYNWQPHRFVREYEALVLELKNKPWPHALVLMTPPKAFPEEKTGVVAFDIQNQVIREEIRPLVFALGEKHGLKVLDLYALTEEHPEYFCDGVHPNSLGNQVIARFLRDRLDP